MVKNFSEPMFTSSVKKLQEDYGSREAYAAMSDKERGTRFGEKEIQFIQARDGFYLSSISSSGWPYVQYRGGPPGFLQVLDETRAAFADFRGNRQYISTGNFIDDDRAALILMDYAAQRRLKILAHVEFIKPDEDPFLADRLVHPHYPAVVERLIVLHLEAFDWNCPQHIAPRYTAAEFLSGMGIAAEHHGRAAELLPDIVAALQTKIAGTEKGEA